MISFARGFTAIAASLALAVLLTPSAPHQADSQSYNCARASTSVEQIICDYSYLGDLDEEMAALYFTIRNSVGSGSRALLEQDQRNWLRLRDRCGYDFSCVERAYLVRINELRTVY